ncbi:META domain-containing protein [Arenibacter aquaticus]|uniref:META domain-containing protein n=1 Tax=Arenibacter aquaticus TaxID=2489054 RepID=A0A430K8I6_9FLAO|nr:META domain-containing protein [Arenibacter aquaticus]RTE55312.1 META domain-containing protein [Arenibacter aquaticus]
MKYITTIIVAFFLASCGAHMKNKQSINTSMNKKWELSAFGENKTSSNRPIYLDLSENGKVSGFVGCNRLMGTYVIESDNQIAFSQLGTTRMACGAKEMELEGQLLQLLSGTNSFTIENGKLNLSNGQSSAIFYEMSDNKIVNKYWKLTTLMGKEVEMADNQEREQYFILKSDHTITGFAGCNHFNGSYKLEEGNRIRFNENLAVTMKACLDGNNNESAFLKVFKMADNYTINGDVLKLNVGRRAPLAVFEAVYF